MQRLLRYILPLSCVLLLPASVSAQTIKITLPDTTTCTYATGQVTSNVTPGQLQATSSGTPIGTGCGNGSSAVTFGPASPLSPSAPTLSSSTGTVNFGFQALNASQCTGSISGATGGVFTNGTTLCNSSTACSANVSAPASFTNSGTVSATYNVAVTCTGSGSPATSNATVTAPPAGTVTAGCTTPPTIPGSGATHWTMLSSTQKVLATYFAAGFQMVDTTKFESIFNNPGAPQKLWPSTYNDTPVISLPTANYMSAAFKPTAPYFQNAPATLYGKITVGESSFTGKISMTISTSCGDFGQIGTIVPGCYLNAGLADAYFIWHSSGSSCVLHDGTQYFLNVINADISQLSTPGGVATATVTTCQSGVCTDPLQNGIGNWSSYIP